VEVKIAIYGWNIHTVGVQVSPVVISVVPCILVALRFSVMCNLEIGEAGQKIGACHEEDAVVGRDGVSGVDAVGHLTPIGRSPSGVILIKRTVVGSVAKRITKHIHFVVCCATGLKLKGGNQGVIVALTNTARIQNGVIIVGRAGSHNVVQVVG